jgi:hypothetical protein
MKPSNWFRAAAVAALFGLAVPASAELIELADGRVLQGEIIGDPDKTNEQGLAVKVIETGGELLIRWEHVLPARAKQLRVRYGIDPEEQEIITTDGHELVLNTGKKEYGLLLNPDTTGPYRLKTVKGEREYLRADVGGVNETEVEIGLIYTPRQAFEAKLAAAPPVGGRDHFDLGLYAFKVEDYEKASEYFALSMDDAEFAKSENGRSANRRKKQADILFTASGAQDLVKKIKSAMARKQWNDARDLMVELKNDFPDENILKAVRAKSLERMVVRGRDKYFSRRVQRMVYKAMRDLIRTKARERRKPSLGEDLKPGKAELGTLAAAKQWASRALPNELWEKVSSSLKLELEEVQSYWDKRTQPQAQYASYGTGTFIVQKRELPTKKRERRRPPGRSKGGNKKKAKKNEPLTEEGWWDTVPMNERTGWLTAHFVEGSDIFDVIRHDKTTKCDSCGGNGFVKIQLAAGGSESQICPRCNGAGNFLRVVYR